MIFWQVLYQLAHVCQRLECHDVRYLERPGQRPRPVRAGQRDTPTQRALDKQWRAVTRRCGSGAVAAVYREVEALLRWLARVASEGYRALTGHAAIRMSAPVAWLTFRTAARWLRLSSCAKATARK
jgi:hypothetical protein